MKSIDDPFSCGNCIRILDPVNYCVTCSRNRCNWTDRKHRYTDHWTNGRKKAPVLNEAKKELPKPTMYLFEILTPREGREKNMTYVWAPSWDEAIAIFHREYPEKETAPVQVRRLFADNSPAFCTGLDGFGDKATTYRPETKTHWEAAGDIDFWEEGRCSAGLLEGK